MGNQTPGLRPVLRRIEALAVLVWTWQPDSMRRHTSFRACFHCSVVSFRGRSVYPGEQSSSRPNLQQVKSRARFSHPIAVAVKAIPAPSTPEELYLDLLKKTLTRAQTVGRYTRRTLLGAGGFEISEIVPTNPLGYSKLVAPIWN